MEPSLAGEIMDALLPSFVQFGPMAVMALLLFLAYRETNQRLMDVIQKNSTALESLSAAVHELKDAATETHRRMEAIERDLLRRPAGAAD